MGATVDAAERFASLLNDYSLPEERPRPTIINKVKDVMARLLKRSNLS